MSMVHQSSTIELYHVLLIMNYLEHVDLSPWPMAAMACMVHSSPAEMTEM